jgi:hypothetical protein
MYAILPGFSAKPQRNLKKPRDMISNFNVSQYGMKDLCLSEFERGCSHKNNMV